MNYNNGDPGTAVAGLPSLPGAIPTAGELLGVIRRYGELTRAQIADVTGISRALVTERVQALTDHGYLRAVSARAPTGRPPELLQIRRDAGVVLAADLGSRPTRFVITDLAGSPMAEISREVDARRALGALLARTHAEFAELLTTTGHGRDDVWAIGVGLPIAPRPLAPVDDRAASETDDALVKQAFAAHYDAMVIAETDVNVAAFGEHALRWQGVEDLLFVSIDAGISCGIIHRRTIHRGSHGVAGSIGHVSVRGFEDVACTCGNTGCLDAVAGGDALAHRLRQTGRAAKGARDVARLAQAGDRMALQALRDAGRALGDVVARVVRFFNPQVVIIGGELARTPEPILAGIREVTPHRIERLIAASLRMGAACVGERATVLGATRLAIESVLAPEVVDRRIAASSGP